MKKTNRACPCFAPLKMNSHVGNYDVGLGEFTPVVSVHAKMRERASIFKWQNAYGKRGLLISLPRAYIAVIFAREQKRAPVTLNSHRRGEPRKKFLESDFFTLDLAMPRRRPGML